jgi:secreted trypsin-like serine protease
VVEIHGECMCEKRKEGDIHRFYASAVVISPRWVLTAAHVVSGNADIKVRVEGKDHPVKRVIVNKNFQEEILGRYDIALCESEDEIELDFYPELYEGNSEVDSVASICGYGVYGTFSSGASKTDGRKRAGSNVVDRVENHVMFCSATKGRKTNLEFMISHGDSGGGLFIDRKLAGINSFVSAADGKTNSNYGDECAHTRVSIFVKWIRGHIRGETPSDDVGR